MRRLLALTLITLACAGCAGSRSPVELARATDAAGCHIDAKQLCKNFFGTPTFRMGLEDYTWQKAELVLPMHATVVIDGVLADGTQVGSIECDVIATQRRVTGGRILSGPPLTPEGLAYLQKNGLCAVQ
jgi:hypothetical protein